MLTDPVDSLNAACETVRLCSRTHSSAHRSQPGTRDALGALGAPLAGHRFATTTATHTDA